MIKLKNNTKKVRIIFTLYVLLFSPHLCANQKTFSHHALTISKGATAASLIITAYAWHLSRKAEKEFKNGNIKEGARLNAQKRKLNGFLTGTTGLSLISGAAYLLLNTKRDESERPSTHASTNNNLNNTPQLRLNTAPHQTTTPLNLNSNPISPRQQSSPRNNSSPQISPPVISSTNPSEAPVSLPKPLQTAPHQTTSSEINLPTVLPDGPVIPPEPLTHTPEVTIQPEWIINDENKTITPPHSPSKPYKNITKQEFALIPRYFIEENPNLKEQFDITVRKKQTLFLTKAKIPVTLFNDMQIFFKLDRILLLHADLQEEELGFEITKDQKFIQYWLQNNVTIYHHLLKWQAKPDNRCKCAPCRLKDFTRKNNNAGNNTILLCDECKGGKKITGTVRATKNTQVPLKIDNTSIKVTIMQQIDNTKEETICKNCKAWECPECKAINDASKEECHCGAISWHCTQCQSHVISKEQELCKSTLSRTGSQGKPCLNKYSKTKRQLNWTCEICFHINKKESNKCEGLLSNDSACREAKKEVPTFSEALLQYPQLKEEYKKYKAHGGYDLSDALQYMDDNPELVVPASSKNLTDKFIKIEAEDYQNCKGDGFCGFRSVTGEFQVEPIASKQLHDFYYPHLIGSNSIEWMSFPGKSANLVKRNIITLIPFGFTQTHLVYRAHIDGSVNSTAPEALEHKPIFVIKAGEGNLHYARLLPHYEDDPTYYYEKFTISPPDVNGNRHVTATRVNR